MGAQRGVEPAGLRFQEAWQKAKEWGALRVKARAWKDEGDLDMTRTWREKPMAEIGQTSCETRRRHQRGNEDIRPKRGTGRPPETQGEYECGAFTDDSSLYIVTKNLPGTRLHARSQR